MKLIIFGASGRTGRLLIDQAVNDHHQVIAVARRPQSIPRRHGLTIVSADVLDAVAAAIDGIDAVLSVLAVKYSREPINLYSLGITNIIAAMHQHKVKRLIAVSSALVEPDWRPSGAFFFNRVVSPLILKPLGRTLYDVIRRMETLVRASRLDWTIVRPSGLFNANRITDYQLAENSADGQYTSRSDLAASMLQQLTDDRFVCKTIGVITTSFRPDLIQLMLFMERGVQEIE